MRCTKEMEDGRTRQVAHRSGAQSAGFFKTAHGTVVWVESAHGWVMEIRFGEAIAQSVNLKASAEHAGQEYLQFFESAEAKPSCIERWLSTSRYLGVPLMSDPDLAFQPFCFRAWCLDVSRKGRHCCSKLLHTMPRAIF
jgi:hypothetical protein